MVYRVVINDGNVMYFNESEYLEAKKGLDYLGIKYNAVVIDEKMYRIQWYDYIDEEWCDIWCTEEDVMEKLEIVKTAEVKYSVIEYN